MFNTEICNLLSIRYPIFQGAMQGAGGPGLVAATSNAGGLGILPTFGGTAEALRADIECTRAQTDKPFAVNITPMGTAFTQSRARICIEMEVPIVTTGKLLASTFNKAKSLLLSFPINLASSSV